MRRRRELNEVIKEKLEQGKDRIVVSASFCITDEFEIGLLEHIWQSNHSSHIKRMIQREKEGGQPNVEPPLTKKESSNSGVDIEAMKSFFK